MDDAVAQCPICTKSFTVDSIEVHVNRCIFLNCEEEKSDENKNNKKRSFDIFNATKDEASAKKARTVDTTEPLSSTLASPSTSNKITEPKENVPKTTKPLAERMRPETIDEYIGQNHITGEKTMLRNILDKNEVPSMILWGPPGVGKTTLAHIIANRCKQTQSVRFVKLSATMSGVNDIKQAVIVAKNEQRFKHKTILFMDEIHRFNKLQQVCFMPPNNKTHRKITQL